MFDYNGFATSGSGGGFTISIGNGGISGGYNPNGGGVIPQYPNTTQYPQYPVSYGGLGGYGTASTDNSMWLLLGAVLLFMVASK